MKTDVSLTVSHTLGQRWKCPAEHEILRGDSNLSSTQTQLSLADLDSAHCGGIGGSLHCVC